MAMKNKTYAHAPNLFALTTACLALTGFACTKSDSLGQAGNKDGGTDTIGKDDTVDTVFCQLNDGRRVPAGAAFAAEDGCNCCVCTSSGQGVCQGAACSFGDAAVASASPGNCQSDQDCLDQGSRLCVFDQGCDSPRGTCMSAGNGVCPGFAVSDLAPFQYCGCDGVTYAIADDVTNPQHYEYPYKPYRHFGACGPNDRADGGPSSPDVPSEARNDGGVDRHDSAPDAAGEDGYEAGTYLCESNADGTCSAVTPNTSCLPLRGVVYDQAANCLSATAITLYCSAWQTNTMGGFATAEGCLQIPKDGGSLPPFPRRGILCAMSDPMPLASPTVPAAPSAGSEVPARDVAMARELAEAHAALTAEIGRRIVGQHEAIEHLLIALVRPRPWPVRRRARLAKTLLIQTLAETLDLSFGRIQFTPDMMPSDITGSDVLEEDRTSGRRVFRFVRGPVFANVVLADEINRTPPKTQAALLQSMQEYRVSAGGNTYDLPLPFLVFATQNPIEQEGTYPLPEAQLDRFMFQIDVGYPTAAEEIRIAALTAGRHANRCARS
jgi:hypothetical protein